ncbi:30S ribosomal protein S6 [Natronospora cellulosivora (SeqCode)]
MVRNYETIYILKPDLEEEVREQLQERITGIINDNQGEILETEVWGTKRLAYEVKDFTSGFYTMINFKGESDLVNELERNYKIIDDVIRYLTIKQED